MAYVVPGTIANGFVASGTITHTTYLSAPDDVFAETTRSFQVTVQKDLWHIETRRVRLRVMGKPELGRGRELSHSAWTDGASVYQLTHFDTTHSAALNVANAKIDHGQCPVQFDQMIHDVWIGLASGPYFRELNKSGRGYIHPLIAYGLTNLYTRDFRVLANWTLSQTPPFLPDEVLFAFAFRFDDADELLVNATLPNTNSHFKVLSHHSAGGMQVPTRYTVAHFRQMPTDWVLGAYSLVVITNVAPVQVGSAIENLFSSPPGPTIVRDDRFRDERTEPFTYWLTNKWLSLRDAQTTHEQFISSRGGVIVKNRLWHGLFAVVVLSPLLVLVGHHFIGRRTVRR